MEIKEILSRCDHTLLRTDCSAREIRELCDDAIRFGCASVCIPPAHVAGAKRYVGDRMKICTVIGFPNGYSTPVVKASEANDAVKNGADEIDMVINLCLVKDGCWDRLTDEVERVKRACSGAVLKVIIETCLLTDEEKVNACLCAKNAGADFVKTSTGFSTGGATVEDVALMRGVVGDALGVKASGGIRSKEAAEAMIAAGASRIGASSSKKIIEG